MNELERDIFIDIHAHIGKYNPSFMGGDEKKLLEQAKAAGIKISIVSSLDAVIYPKFNWSKDLLIKGNEDVLKAIKMNKTLYGWCVLNPLIDKSWDQCEKFLKEERILGIKLHPTFHKYDIKRYSKKIYRICKISKKNVLLIHSEDDIFSSPFKLIEAFKAYKDLIVIIAHLGYSKDRNNRTMHIEAIKKSKSENFYVDTSSLNICFSGLLEEAVSKISSDRILLGTDNVIHFPASIVSRIKFSNLSHEEKAKILYRNAVKIFKFNNS